MKYLFTIIILLIILACNDNITSTNTRDVDILNERVSVCQQNLQECENETALTQTREILQQCREENSLYKYCAEKASLYGVVYAGCIVLTGQTQTDACSKVLELEERCPIYVNVE